MQCNASYRPAHSLLTSCCHFSIISAGAKRFAVSRALVPHDALRASSAIILDSARAYAAVSPCGTMRPL